MSMEFKKLLEDSNVEIKSAIESKASAQEVAELKTRLEAAETALARPTLIKSSTESEEFRAYKSALVAYLRAPDSNSAKSALRELSVKNNTVTGPAGGYAVPKLILDGIANAPVKLGAVRRLAEVVTAETPEVSKLVEVSGFGYEWVSETGTRSATNTAVYDSRTPTWGVLAAKAPVTLNMLEDASFDVFSEVINGINRQFAAGEANAFIVGTGSDQPTGILAGNTVTNVVSGNASAITSADVFLDMITAVDSQYHAGAVFLMNSATKAAIAKLKNSEGDSIVRDSVVVGYPSTLWGFPIEIDENMPAIAANARPVVFGNLYAGYLVADRGSMTIMEDPYTNLGYVNFIGRKRVGGVVKDSRALKALKIAAS